MAVSANEPFGDYPAFNTPLSRGQEIHWLGAMRALHKVAGRIHKEGDISEALRLCREKLLATKSLIIGAVPCGPYGITSVFS